MPQVALLVEMLPQLVALGAERTTTQQALEILGRCSSAAELLKHAGTPDRIEEWTGKDDVYSQEMQKKGEHVQRFVTRYCYDKQWYPLMVQVCELEDSRLSFAFAVDKRELKGP